MHVNRSWTLDCRSKGLEASHPAFRTESIRPRLEQSPSNENQIGGNPMDYRYLGRSGFRVPALSLGTATFGGKGDFFAAWGDTGAEQATRLVGSCLDFGLKSAITPDVDSAGLAEEILGAAIKCKRDRIIISTKATFRSGDGPNDVGSSRYHLINACEK